MQENISVSQMFLVDTWMLTVKPVEKLEMCFMI